MYKEKISVLVPVYNGDKTISKCLNSIINQTYKNIEIIVLNDNSNDNTKKILKEYQVKIYNNKKNMGIGYCREELIKKCKTPYFIFVDSDDELEKESIELLYKEMLKEKADIVMGSINNLKKEKIILENEDLYAYLFNKNNNYYTTMWNKLYNKKVFLNYSFNNLTIAEDDYIFPRILSNINKIVIIPNITYKYNHNQNSITNKSINYKEKCFVMTDRYNMFKNTKYEKKCFMYNKGYYLGLLKELVNKNVDYKEYRKYLIKKFKIKYLFRFKIRELLLVIFPKTFINIRKKVIH